MSSDCILSDNINNENNENRELSGEVKYNEQLDNVVNSKQNEPKIEETEKEETEKDETEKEDTEKEETEKEDTEKEETEKEDTEKEETKKPKIIKNIVFGGGGFKGLSLIGFIKALEYYNDSVCIEKVVGSSIGSFVGLLLILGYSSSEMEDIIKNFNIKEIQDISAETILNFPSTFGIDTSDKYIEFIKNIIYKKNCSPYITMLSLYQKYNIRFIVNASCLNDMQEYYFDYLTEPDMPVWLAVRISCSLPILYPPVNYKNKLFVDGGIIDGLPMRTCETELDTSVGVEFESLKVSELNNSIINYLLLVCQCMRQVNKNILKYPNNILILDTQNIQMYQNTIDKELIKNMINCSYLESKNYLKNFLELEL